MAVIVRVKHTEIKLADTLISSDDSKKYDRVDLESDKYGCL